MLGLLLIVVASADHQVPISMVSVQISSVHLEYRIAIKDNANQKFTTSVHASPWRMKSTLHTQQTKMLIVSAANVGMMLQIP